MSSFNRAQYEEVYQFALASLLYWESRDEQQEAWAVRVMWMCEDVIGQQEDFPEWARESYSRKKVNLE